MKSEFYNVALDRVRYSLVWEGSDTLYKSLDIQPDDRLLIITSAGCNVLNALLKNPEQLTAIDLNPVQNRLLRFKKSLILSQDHAVFRALLGLEGPAAVAAAWQKVLPQLDPEETTYWSPFFVEHPEGLMAAGKLESYLNGFYHSLPALLKQKLQQLLSFTQVAAQRQYFMQELHSSDFRPRFIEYFDEENLSKGRDPKLFRYAEESGGESFYLRLLQQVSRELVRDNFFFRFFFFGAEGLPESILPPCYRQENYEKLRAQLHKLKIVQGEAVDYLLSGEGASITKASLSNIFEYASPAEFQRVCQALFLQPGRSLRIVYWNLLQNQGEGIANGEEAVQPEWLQAQLSQCLSQQEACFYFRNVRVLEAVPVPVQF